MKTAGIIGGIGPESTVQYYREIIAAYRERLPDGSAPSIIINSIDLHKMLGLVSDGRLEEVAGYLAGEVQRLAQAGADFGVLAANTPHIVFDEISRRSSIPLISIVQVTADAATRMGLRRLGLFGTSFTMRSRFYPDVLSREGITVVLPGPEAQAYIHDKYMSELVKGIFLPQTRERLLAIARELVETDAIEGLVLGGTELPLILPDANVNGVPILDTTRIHVEAIVGELLS